MNYNFNINTINKTFLLIAVCVLLASCTRNFEEINRNPNSSENIDPQYLLSNVVSVAANANTYDQGFRLANYLAQFAASVEFERIDRYEMGTNSEYWNTIYALLTDIKSIQTVEGTNEAYIAVGNIMQCYLFSQLTDIWGDIPYTQALLAKEGITAPVYDTQEDIYTNPTSGILATLREANNTLENTTASINGDVMFGNSLEQWQRFANSLLVRYTLRISKRLSDFSELQELADSGLLMESNADNAVVPYLSAAPNQFPMSQASQGLYQEHRMTKTVETILTDWNDPRVEVLYKPTGKSLIDNNPEYKGLLNGQSRETISAEGIDLNDISLFGSIYRDVANGVDGQFMIYSELLFALAEAVQRGYISGDANQLYTNAIQAHFDYLELEMPSDYMNQDLVTLDSGDEVEKIMTQKWLSLISNGHEAWFNLRRTGFPSLQPGPDNLNNGKFPVRYLYPESEQATNSVNYQEASQRMGGDNINSKNWWEE